MTMAGLDTLIAQWSFPLWQTAGAFLLTVAAFFGTGKLLLRSFPKENFAAFALGTLAVMGAAALLPASRLLLFCLLLPPAIWGIWKSVDVVKKNPLLSIAAVVLFLFFLGSALLIPYSWDEQTYQVALPLRYLQTGSSGPFPDNPYSCYPPLTSRFFARMIALGGIEMPRLLVGVITPLLIAGTAALVKPFRGIAPWATGLCLLLSPLVLTLNRAVNVENFIALFTLGGFFAALKLRKHPFAAPLVSGLLAGGAFAVKPTGSLGALFLLIFFLFSFREWKKWGLFCLCAFTASFFWYLPAFLATKNFFYPYSPAPEPGSVEHFHHLLGSARYGLEGVTGALLNWLFAGFDKKLFDGIVTGFQMPFLGIAALAGIYLKSKVHPRYKKFAIAGAAAFLLPLLLWSILFPQSRFLLPLLPFAAAAGAVAVFRSNFRKVEVVLLGLLLAGTLFFQSYPLLKHYWISWKILPHVRKAPGAALGFLTRDPGLYRSYAYVAENTPLQSRCLLLMERRGLYAPRPYAIACPGFEPSLTPVPESSEKLFEKLRSFDYIIVGNTTQDVDLQSANAEDCKKVFLQLKELAEKGKVRMMPCDGYPVLQIIKQGGKK